MLTDRDAETDRGQQHEKQGELEPINTEIPQVQRHCGECENKRADQKRTGRPIDAAGRNTENQERKFLGRIVGSLISAENDILLCPGMHAAAVRTGKLLRFQFHCWPGFFFDCPASIGQLRRRRTAHQQAFDIGPGFYFRASRRIKQESGRHIRVGKRYELSRCRKATSPFSLDHQS